MRGRRFYLDSSPHPSPLPKERGQCCQSLLILNLRHVFQAFVSINPRAMPVIPGDLDGVAAHGLDFERFQLLGFARCFPVKGQRVFLILFAQGAGAVLPQIRQRITAFLSIVPMDAKGFTVHPVKLGAFVVERERGVYHRRSVYRCSEINSSVQGWWWCGST